MNDRVVIFQRNTTMQAREAEVTQLAADANAQGLQPVSISVASGQPQLLTIDMLIGHCIARKQAGHLVLSSLDLLWTGTGLQDGTGKAGESQYDRPRGTAETT